MLRFWQKAGLLCATLFIFSCAKIFYQNIKLHDTEPLKVQTIDLFNQVNKPLGSFKSWQGDWYFRRQRLLLIDSFLLQTKAHIVFFSEALSRSHRESDMSILRTHSLKNYDILSTEVDSHLSTDEKEYLALGFTSPVHISDLYNLILTYRIEKEGSTTQTILTHENQEIILFNVHMSENSGKQKSFAELTTILTNSLNSQKTCPKRIIIAGQFLGSSIDPDYLKFLEQFNLKDSAIFCEIVTQCYTQTPENKIFFRSHGEKYPQRTDRILVSDETIIHKSHRILNQKKADSFSAGKPYGLEALWPTERYGWEATIVLPRCY